MGLLIFISDDKSVNFGCKYLRMPAGFLKPSRHKMEIKLAISYLGVTNIVYGRLFPSPLSLPFSLSLSVSSRHSFFFSYVNDFLPLGIPIC